jgi:hypothetical protein
MKTKLCQFAVNLGEQTRNYLVSSYLGKVAIGLGITDPQEKACPNGRRSPGFRLIALDFADYVADTSNITPSPLSPLVGDAHHGEVFLCAIQTSDGLRFRTLSHLQFNEFGGGR